MTPEQASAGTVLSSRYTLTERIAVGGMGEVWAATDAVLNRTVAVKLMSPALSQESGFVERFRAEARHSAALQHPNIATVFDYSEDDGTAYLVMELVAGQPLSQVIAERAPLSAQETSSVLIQAAMALEAAHQGGVVHRDVKPANILITADGTVKLTDFGISRLVDTAPLTQTGQILGTAQYLSPEQALGQAATAASDIYALGVVGYEMLTGRRPFDAGTAVATALAQINQPPPELPGTVPVGVREVISACLAKAPADRPPTAAAMAHALGMPDAAFGSGLPAVPGASAARPTPAAPTRAMPTPPASAAPAALTQAMPTPPASAAPAALTQAMPTLPAPAAPTRAMPTLPAPAALTQAMFTLPTPVAPTNPTGPPGIPARRRRWQPAWLLGMAAFAVLGILTVFVLAGGTGSAGTGRTPAANTATASTPSTRATASYAPPVTTSSGPGQLNREKGHGPGHANKKDGKQ